jgi:hypothetical protein
MTREQRGPLVAFFALAAVTFGLLAHALASEPVSGLFVAPAQSVIGGVALSPLSSQAIAARDAQERSRRVNGVPRVITDQVVTHIVAVDTVGRSADNLAARAGQPGSLVQDPVKMVTHSLNSQPGLTGAVVAGTSTLVAQTVDGVLTSVSSAVTGNTATSLFGSSFHYPTALSSESATASASPSPSASASESATAEPSQSESATGSATPSPSASASAQPGASPSATASSSGRGTRPGHGSSPSGQQRDRGNGWSNGRGKASASASATASSSATASATPSGSASSDRGTRRGHRDSYGDAGRRDKSDHKSDRGSRFVRGSQESTSQRSKAAKSSKNGRAHGKAKAKGK